MITTSPSLYFGSLETHKNNKTTNLQSVYNAERETTISTAGGGSVLATAGRDYYAGVKARFLTVWSWFRHSWAVIGVSLQVERDARLHDIASHAPYVVSNAPTPPQTHQPTNRRARTYQTTHIHANGPRTRNC